MNFIIPMAGRGSRFRREGFVLPKFLIPCAGRTLLEWSLQSLPLDLATQVVFVGLAADNDHGKLEEEIRNSLPALASKLSFTWLEEVTNGQATTVCAGITDLSETEPLVIYNIDTTFLDVGLRNRLQESDWQGLLGSFSSQASNLSYAALDASGQVCRVVEKEVISSYALNGLYAFRSVALFREAYQALGSEILNEKGEIFVAPLYEYLLQKELSIVLSESEETHPLGTPVELRRFEEIAVDYGARFEVKG